ncbi:LysR family transcriptional regulator [Xanthomonas arboricola pv. juglandis]|uniref:HTH-type transcriptional regulator DmlR n=1 Tax=Xanthomonas arboricola pv. corylina TaxID=487821 RepID=A0A2S7CL48_9XANT|nr:MULTISPECIES: LysR family transcriptional regulator [Xanthomonas]AKU51848.1 LysR family transcriptional regulator [Xanthomonas arboricola pv. juglandis]KOA98294.1 LysR family transcriptional regulator [Xanthomonas arboricola]KOB08742.1 LysR family transcriptional regulator [Xanthomonas arboricola]KOB09430.1 LysR family transcriptional regulator [Xanthomonas arboricola]KOB14985.1 LysR family transcriptional regulator [Xanthomonas arboricola]
MDLLDSMQVFVRVVDGGSLAAAAQAHGISPTMAGNHLRALEQRLGLQLLVRTTRRQRLTAFGEAYYGRCREILELVADTQVQADGQRLEPAGPLRVAAPVSFGTYGLTPVLGEYLQRHPQVSLDLQLSDRVQDLVDEGIDVAVRIGVLGESSLVARALQPYRLWCCATPAYLHRNGTPQRLADLAGHQCLGMDAKALGQWQDYTGERIGPLSRAQLHLTSGPALHLAALQGLGIVLQPAFLLRADVEAGRLVRLFQDRELHRPLSVLYPQTRWRSVTVRSFVDFLLERFA